MLWSRATTALTPNSATADQVSRRWRLARGAMARPLDGDPQDGHMLHACVGDDLRRPAPAAGSPAVPQGHHDVARVDDSRGRPAPTPPRVLPYATSSVTAAACPSSSWNSAF